MSLSEWTRQELLQAAAIVGSIITATLGAITVRMARNIHIMINSRLGQMISGAQAEGRTKERAEQDVRDRMQEARADLKDKEAPK